MNQIESKPKDLAARVFEKTGFQFGWLLVLISMFTFIGIPAQRVLIVFWVRGSDAYFHQGIRVLKGKPVKFSDGQPVPDFPDFVTGMAMFLLVTVGLSYLLIWILRFYEKRQDRSRNAA